MTLRRFKTWTLILSTACLLLAGWMLFHSLSGGSLVGCGAGSACDHVMSSPWAYFLGGVPVSLPAVVVYALLILCILFLEDCRSVPAMTEGSVPAMTESRHPRPDRGSLNAILWPLMLILSGCIIGAALWFCYLQAFVLHAFCPYCTLLHLLGITAAVLVILAAKRFGKRICLPLLAGLVAAALFAGLQSFTRPEAIYDSGRTEAALPAFEEGEIPMLGDCRSVPAMTEGSLPAITLLFDFQCSHCRQLHRILPQIAEQYRIFLAPVPLSSACNPYIPSSGIDRFKGSCELTRLAMAVWYAKPGEASAYWDYLLEEEASPADAEKRARELLGDGFASAMADPRIDAYLRKVEELFGRTSSGEKSGVPRFISGQRGLVPETDNAETILQLLHQ